MTTETSSSIPTLVVRTYDVLVERETLPSGQVVYVATMPEVDGFIAQADTMAGIPAEVDALWADWCRLADDRGVPFDRRDGFLYRYPSPTDRSPRDG